MRDEPASVQSFSCSSRRYLKRASSGAAKFKLAKDRSSRSLPAGTVIDRRLSESKLLVFCSLPSTSTDWMTTGGGLVLGLRSAGLTETKPLVVENHSRPSCVRQAAGWEPSVHSS